MKTSASDTTAELKKLPTRFIVENRFVGNKKIGDVFQSVIEDELKKKMKTLANDTPNMV